MDVGTLTKRRGNQHVRGWGEVEPGSISISPLDGRVQIRVGEHSKPGWVLVSIDELRAVIDFLRASGIEIDPEREDQRRLAWQLAESLGRPSGKTT